MASSNQGIVFDIQKFALDDGPGIRTVVFLKGCTLRCAWCCNPESHRRSPELGFHATRCNNCGDCIASCPEKAISAGSSTISINFDLCTACAKCTEVCPKNALRIFGRTVTSEEIIAEVAKDDAYFKNSGGGLTLSGGEALVQLEFATSLLKLAKEKGLHTCVETAGNIPQSSFEQVLPFVDRFLFDYKQTDPQLHKKWTGATNELILSNFDFLYRSGAEIVMRCPIIPTANETEEHFRGIVAMSQKYPNLKGVEVMPYHEYGVDKYLQIGRKPFRLESGTATKLQRQQWRDKLIQLGCKNLF
jgi:pyruvate formate lyase activating enzyme